MDPLLKALAEVRKAVEERWFEDHLDADEFEFLADFHWGLTAWSWQLAEPDLVEFLSHS